MKTLGYYLDAFFKAEIEGQQDLAWSKTGVQLLYAHNKHFNNNFFLWQS